jgi:hypothetical protein
MSGLQHARLKGHLFPGDNLEAAAVLLCSDSGGSAPRLLVQSVLEIDYAACRVREPDRITWPGSVIETALEQAEAKGLSLLLIHSHPSGLLAFSSLDDSSDRDVIPSLLQNHGEFHGSAIMTSDGAVRARWYANDLTPRAFELVCVVGDDILLWWDADATTQYPARRPMAFTAAMTKELNKLTAMVVGVSGTGSVMAEQALRLGFGKVKLVDYDLIEQKNLNRILNSTTDDVQQNRLKVDMFERAALSYRESGVVQTFPTSILSREAVLAAGQCDVLFGCVDSLEGRRILDLISSCFLLPLIDVGVSIPTRRCGKGAAIGDVCGRIDYVQPGGSSLKDRRVYSAESLRAEYLRRNAPESHRQEVDAGYFGGIAEEAPAVISLNMRAASAAMNEFIARAYPFRHEPNHQYARTLFSLAACEEEHFDESTFPATSTKHTGRGAQEPLLNLPALAVLSLGRQS